MSGNPALCGLASGLNAYVSGASLGQAVKTGAIAWATAEGFQWAGQQGPAGSAPASRAAATSFERYAAHAAVGCVSSAVGGGQCGSGAASAVFGKFATNTIGGPGVNTDFGEVLAKGVATAVAGGVGSVIAGGKFENGAKTAAYGYLFNELLRDKNGSSFKSKGRYYEGDRTLGGYDTGAYLCSSVPPSSSEQYEALKLIVMPSGIGRIATTFIDASLTVYEFSAGNRMEGYKGLGSMFIGTGVELMLRPLGPGAAGVGGHLTGIAYDQVPEKKY